MKRNWLAPPRDAARLKKGNSAGADWLRVWPQRENDHPDKTPQVDKVIRSWEKAIRMRACACKWSPVRSRAPSRCRLRYSIFFFTSPLPPLSTCLFQLVQPVVRRRARACKAVLMRLRQVGKKNHSISEL